MSPSVDSLPFDLTRYQDPMTIQRVLHNAETVAIVGLSSKDESEILGEKSFESLVDLPEPVDIVVVFRAPDALPTIAAEAVKIGAGTLWCQFGVINEDGGRIAESGGMNVVMDRCLKVEHARYVGRMHWLGFNTQRITSVRGGLQ
jgi:predicted CoA-binding protein